MAVFERLVRVRRPFRPGIVANRCQGCRDRGNRATLREHSKGLRGNGVDPMKSRKPSGIEALDEKGSAVA